MRVVTSLPYTEFEVANGNYDKTRATIDRVILHTEVGFKTGTEATFDNPQSHVSAHYGVNQDGSIDHYLEEFYTAYHSGDYAMNQRSIGIEHEDLGKPNDPRPDVLYATSAKLVQDICQFYNIPIDRAYILKHSEVSDVATSCPDSLDVERIVNLANQGSDSNINRKSSFFDQIWLHRFGTNTNTDLATQQQVTDFIAWLDSNVNRAGKWDQVSTKFLGSVDSNKVTVQQIIDKAGNAPALQAKIDKAKSDLA